MLCLHPFCPLGSPVTSWAETLDRSELKLRKGPERDALLITLNSLFGAVPTNPAKPQPAPTTNAAALRRLLRFCPCLYNQVDTPPSAHGIVHLCELSVGGRITDLNVVEAFKVQHPKTLGWAYPPAQPFQGSGGTVMELLCSGVLASAGIPAMELDTNDWPIWRMPGHILLNDGKMGDLKALGDILLPCAPTNLIISVKSEKARERLLYSANSIEGIGFGFFDTPSEFWTKRRMQLYKRMGFSAIYMPETTLDTLNQKIDADGNRHYAVNINGTALYRPLTQFCTDMHSVVGKSAFDL
jgi:hypothetical protein